MGLFLWFLLRTFEDAPSRTTKEIYLENGTAPHVTKPKEHIIIMSTIDKNGFLNVDTVENTILTNNDYKLEVITAILNSKLIGWYAYRYIFSKAVRTMDFDDYYIGKIPIPSINKTDETEIISYVEKIQTDIIQLHKLDNKRTDEYNQIEKNIEYINGKIDEIIFRIYGLSDQEIKHITNET